MTKERLSEFSREDLDLIAKKCGIDPADYEDAEELIDEIVEAYEDEKLERETLVNQAMSVKKKKFEVFPDDAPDLSETEENLHEFDLLSQSRIHLLLRDPMWAFAFWFFGQQDYARIKERKPELFLRVYQSVGKGSIDRRFAESYDIPISFGDSKWYINLPETGCTYEVDLMCKDFGQECFIATSNRVETPSLDFDERFRNNIDEMLISSGLYEILSSKTLSSEVSSKKILTDEEIGLAK